MFPNIVWTIKSKDNKTHTILLERKYSKWMEKHGYVVTITTTDSKEKPVKSSFPDYLSSMGYVEREMGKILFYGGTVTRTG